jgi:hypothetical protein
MAMLKYHITKKGEPGVCYAKHSCPLGSADEHFNSSREAATAYETKMTAELIPQGKTKETLGKRELNQLARITSDNDLIKKALEEGSSQTYKALAKNPNVGMHHLVYAYNSTDDLAVHEELTKHPRFPVGKMTPDQWYRRLNDNVQYGSRYDYLRKDTHIGDEHIKVWQENNGSGNVAAYSQLREIVRNPDNKLSQEKIVELAEANYTLMGAAMDSNRYPADRIKDLPDNLVYWGNVYKNSNPDYLDGYADWAIKNEGGYKSMDILQKVAGNENTSSATLEKIARSGYADREVYGNPNTSAKVKASLEARNPEVASMAKVDRLIEAHGDLKNKLTVKNDVNSPFGGNRGIRDTVIQLDPKKVKELGLTKTDIGVVFNSRVYNAGFSYDEESGIIKGSSDTTD